MSDETTSKYWELVIYPLNEGGNRENVHIRTPDEPQQKDLLGNMLNRIGRGEMDDPKVTLSPVNDTVGKEAWLATNNSLGIMMLNPEAQILHAVSEGLSNKPVEPVEESDKSLDDLVDSSEKLAEEAEKVEEKAKTLREEKAKTLLRGRTREVRKQHTFLSDKKGGNND